MFNGAGSVFGTYVLYYKLDEVVPLGCEDTSQLVIRLDSTASAGIDGLIGRCEHIPDRLIWIRYLHSNKPGVRGNIRGQ